MVNKQRVSNTPIPGSRVALDQSVVPLVRQEVLSFVRLWRDYDLRVAICETSGGYWQVRIDNMVCFQHALREEQVVTAWYEEGVDVIDALVDELRSHRYLVIKRPWYRRDVRIDLDRYRVER